MPPFLTTQRMTWALFCTTTGAELTATRSALPTFFAGQCLARSLTLAGLPTVARRVWR